MRARSRIPKNVLRSERDQGVREAVLKIAPQYRMVLVLHDREGLNTAEFARVTGLREATVRVRVHRARLMLRQHLARRGKAKGVAQIHAAAEALPKRSRHCRQMFASLSDYMDGLVKDVRYRDMEKHLHECQPCVAFLDSLMSAVEQCRTYQPSCDIESATKPRKVLVEKYQAAVAALPKARA